MAGKLRTPWQVRSGEIAQLNVPPLQLAVCFHPSLDGRGFFIPSRGRCMFRRVYGFFRSLFLPFFVSPSFLALPAFFRSSFFRSFHLSRLALSHFFLFFVSFSVLRFSLFSAFLFLLSVLFFPPFPPFPLCSLRI